MVVAAGALALVLTVVRRSPESVLSLDLGTREARRGERPLERHGRRVGEHLHGRAAGRAASVERIAVRLGGFTHARAEAELFQSRLVDGHGGWRTPWSPATDDDPPS